MTVPINTQTINGFAPWFQAWTAGTTTLGDEAIPLIERGRLGGTECASAASRTPTVRASSRTATPGGRPKC